MILIDTSIWIELFSKKNRYRVTGEELLQVVVCPPVIQEILQGLKADAGFEKIKDLLLAFPRIGDPTVLSDYLLAADIYRSGRARGLTIRSSVDCLIAALALGHKATVWHQDRDFESIARFTALKVTQASPFGG